MSSDTNDHFGVPQYAMILAALLVLTGVTVGAAFVDMGALNTFVAVLIAMIKATLVITFFMHVRWSGKLVGVFAFSGFFWLLIMLTITWSDVSTRDLLIPTAYPW